MNYEAWRITYQDPEQAARAAFDLAGIESGKVANLERRANDYDMAIASLVSALYKAGYANKG